MREMIGTQNTKMGFATSAVKRGGSFGTVIHIRMKSILKIRLNMSGGAMTVGMKDIMTFDGRIESINWPDGL